MLHIIHLNRFVIIDLATLKHILRYIRINRIKQSRTYYTAWINRNYGTELQIPSYFQIALSF